MAELAALMQREIPEGQKLLQESHVNLEHVADYCERNYLQATDKAFALDETKNFTTQALASVAYQINVLATNTLQLLDLQANQLGDMESSINHLSQIVMIHKEKVARREIGVLTTNKNTSKQHKIIAPANPEKPMKYTRKAIDYCVLDEIGHGIKGPANSPHVNVIAGVATATMPARSSMKRTPSTGSAQSAGVNRPGATPGQMTLPPNASIASLGGSEAPSSQPPTPPTMHRGMGTLSRNSGNYRGPPQPVAPPSIPDVYNLHPDARNYGTLGRQSPRRDSAASSTSLTSSLGTSLQTSQTSIPRAYATLQHRGRAGTENYGTLGGVGDVGLGPPQPPQVPFDNASLYGAGGVSLGPQAPVQAGSQVQIGLAYPMQPSAATHNYLATLPRGGLARSGAELAYGGYGGLPDGFPVTGICGGVGGGMGYMSEDLMPPPPQSALFESQQQAEQQTRLYNAVAGGPVRPQAPPPAVPQNEYGVGLRQGGYINDNEGNTLKFIEKVVAIYDYEADKEDELTFLENAVIHVIKKNDDGWWEGVLNGVRGLFPGNYVEPLI